MSKRIDELKTFLAESDKRKEELLKRQDILEITRMFAEIRLILAQTEMVDLTLLNSLGGEND